MTATTIRMLRPSRRALEVLFVALALLAATLPGLPVGQGQ